MLMGSGPIIPARIAPSAAPSLVASLPQISGLTGIFLPLGQAISLTFNIGGAPIAVLGGVFSGGLPIGGPFTQVFRGGSAPTPPTLFITTLTSSGPIGAPFIGSSGAPIGVQTVGGGALPIGVPPGIAAELAAIQPRTALVGAAPAFPGIVTPPAVSFASVTAAGAAPAIGGSAASSPGGGAISG